MSSRTAIRPAGYDMEGNRLGHRSHRGDSILHCASPRLQRGPGARDRPGSWMSARRRAAAKPMRSVTKYQEVW